MRHIGSAWIAVLFLFFFCDISNSDSVRENASASAQNNFFNLNFFSEGRGMHLVPGLIEVLDKFSESKIGQKQSDEMMNRQWGLVIENHWPAGLFKENYKQMKVGALGCVACHSSRVAGQYVIGLGNKNIDVLQIGKDASLIENMYRKINPFPRHDSDYKRVESSALEFANLLSNPKLGNLTQGLVPVSFIRAWFYKQANLGIPSTMTRGAVKIPPLWGYGEKRKVGQFSDGFGDGTLPGWAVAVELTGGQIPETVRSYLPKIETTEKLLEDFLPPKYPFLIDGPKTVAGQVVFTKTCSKCHGTYRNDPEGLPIYEAPRWIDLAVVVTDSDRLDSNSDEFKKLVDQSPLNDVIKHNNFGRGYFAPRLVGIWSRFPYLHNGSVPSISKLLLAPEERPKTFSLEDAGELYRFDKENLGLTPPKDGVDLTKSKRRWIYSTDKPGQSNKGHQFGLNLTNEDKRNLIEYLKTL